MIKKGLNPYLPFWETIPDGEPHIFDGRLYIYGSHDNLHGTTFCEEDYVCWSAPVEDPGDWRCEGVIYKKSQDPINGASYDKKMPAYEPSFMGESGEHRLYAPDVAKGPDGRYYLYYALDFVNIMSVAVCATPAGSYEFLDYIRCEDGSVPTGSRWFDPAILCEEDGNFLYYGFCPQFKFPGMEETQYPGAMVVRLADDMHTIISEPECVAYGVEMAEGTDYEAHPFFEASSIRHIGEWYYFVYSSLQGHELCYGMAKTPEGPFVFKGVIVSNGDIGYKGNQLPVNYTGNNHGGLVQIGTKVYIFWHRHTHGTAFSRQGCADAVQILADGTIPQIEITSCGLNDGPLLAREKYLTYIACHITEGERANVGQVAMAMPGEVLVLPEDMPYIMEEAGKEDTGKGKAGLKPYIHNLQKGAAAGFKYLRFDGNETEINIEVRGMGIVRVLIDAPDGPLLAEVKAEGRENGWRMCSNKIQVTKEVHAVYFCVVEGCVDFASFEFC